MENLLKTFNSGYSIPLQYKGDQKRERSAHIFNENKISTCSFVKKKGNNY